MTNIGPGPPPALILHSPLSPLTPISSLYPDGVIDQQWITKHQCHLPSALLMVLHLTADPNTSSLLDNKLRAEINAVKSALSSTNYKTKLVVILLGDEVIAPAEVEERVGAIRKLTLLEQRSLCFIPSDSSPQDVLEVITSLLNALHPQSIEYYRELSKHTRRKRNRNATPQPTIPPTTAHNLPPQGWIVRYEFKLAVFAEFRQEMDAAYRSYETAYESLFTPELIESVASWSPRFQQARLLADVIALRMIRCLLWTAQHTAAVKVWRGHQARVADLLDRRGKGIETYAWEAWQSTWSKTMADLLTRADLPGLQSHGSVFVSSDQPVAVPEAILPADQLHHQGYWLQRAQKHTRRRRERAINIPEEDRQTPAKPPTTHPGSRAQKYDTYLVPEPHEEAPVDSGDGFDHKAEILRLLDSAENLFAQRGQLRLQEQLQLDRAREHIRSGSWADAIEVLQPVWEKSTWRKAGWWRLLEHAGWLLFECAREANDPELLLRLVWELANSSYSPRPDFDYGLDGAIRADTPDEKLSVVFTSQYAASRIVTSFAFSTAEGHVGEPVDCQLVINSPTMAGVPPMALSHIKIAFEGALKLILLTHSADLGEVERSGTISADIQLDDSTQLTPPEKRYSASALPSTSGQADLSIYPGQTKIFNFSVTPRESGDLTTASITAMIEVEKYSIAVINTETEQDDSVWWETRDGHPIRRDIGVQRAATTFHALPKPPKVEISAINFRKAYYTNEKVVIDLMVLNNEDAAVVSKLQARLISPLTEAAHVSWVDQESNEETKVQNVEQLLPARSLEELAPGSSAMLSLSLSETFVAIDHELEVSILYSMKADSGSLLQKTLTLDIAIIRPFEANYDFVPRRSTGEWPSYFAPPPTGTDVPSGLTQTFSVAANLFSFALEPVVIEAILLTTSSITGGAICSSTTGTLLTLSAAEPRAEDGISTSIAPEETKNFNFDLTIQKLVLGDRETVSLELLLEIGWRRPGSDLVNTTILEVPRFVNPMAEPRVLLTIDGTARLPSPQDMQLISLRYTIENPSMHFLTFNVSMEASEDYAFSGPKASAVSLVPISKYEIEYKILPNKRDTEGAKERRKEKDKKGEWLKVQLNVVDAYFNQTLRVQPAGEGVKLDKRGAVVVLIE
jgi:trafficking protein particle complex subunit 11